MSHDPRFSIVPGWIVTDPRLKGRDLQVLCVLGRHTDKGGWCRRSQVKMAGELGCARSTVQASIDRLTDIGVVEKHEQVSDDGRDSAHFYRVVYDRAPPAGYDFAAWQDQPEEENIPSEGNIESTPPADISAPPAGPEPAPPADIGSAPINDPSLTPPVERRERERANANENEDDPKQLMRRVKALEIGRNNNPWPGVLGSSTNWALAQFEKLSPEMRYLAEERRDDYLAVCKAQNVKPVALGVYCRDLKFLDVTPQVARAAAAKVERVAMKPFGPVWAGTRSFLLGRGPSRVDMPGNVREMEELKFTTLLRSNEGAARRRLASKGIVINDAGQLIFPDDFERAEYKRRQCEQGYPEVNRLHQLASSQQSEPTDGRNGLLGELCEAVPVGSQMYEAWRAFHIERNLPLWPDPGTMRVVYFPKGGPDRFEEFMRAAYAVMTDNRSEGNVDAAAG